MPGFAAGGLVSAVTTLPVASAGAEFGGRSASPLTLVIGSERFEGLQAPRETAERPARYAISQQIRSAGRKPEWFKG